MNTDSIRVASAGFGGSIISGLEFLPDLLSMLCGVITLLYMSLQLQKEYSNVKKKKKKKK
jgi:hypothetical protein